MNTYNTSRHFPAVECDGGIKVGFFQNFDENWE